MDLVSDEIIITQATTDLELDQILNLQLTNHKDTISKEDALKNGFVTVRHTKALLEEICKPYHHIIAKRSDQIVGYALVMLKEHGNRIPELAMMDQVLSQLSFEGKALHTCTYVIMGQICIAENARGLHVFDKMYYYMQEYLHQDFDYIITEIAERNQRSMRAHQRVGFLKIHTYLEESIDEVWNIVLLPTK
jgi:hypothetical protein